MGSGRAVSRSIDFPPLQNGVDYLQDAVHRLGETPSPQDLKYAVLHLHAGVEVLLKYRLICDDWRLIIEDTDDVLEVTEEDYERGRFRSIGIGKALKRLRELDGITITSGQRRAAAALDKFRNQLQHHGLTSTAEAVESQAAAVLGFILDFIDNYITPEIHPTEDDAEILTDAMRDIRSGLGRITALVNERMKTLHPVLASASIAWCPDCGQPAVLMDGHDTRDPDVDEPRCAFCTARWDSRSHYVEDFIGMRLGLSHYQAAQDGVAPPTEHCPECGADMLVWYNPDSGDQSPGLFGHCFHCEEEFNDRCPRCGVAVDNPYEGENKLCDDCFNHLG